MTILTRFIGWFFSWFVLGALVALVIFIGTVDHYSQELPDTGSLSQYEPSTVSKVYDGEGQVIDEFAVERRLYTPIDEIPDDIKFAFISAEDKNFYNHAGYDVRGMARALRDALQGGNQTGASTIPQQVAKNFLLSGERTVDRKIKEIILANRMVNTMDRDDILGLYLNDIFLGQNSYGVTAAARTYFSKTLEELTPEEAAYLAAIPREPSNFHPVRNHDRAITARDNVLREMYENGYIEEDIYESAQSTALLTVQSGDIEPYRASIPPRDYFTDEIRRQLADEVGGDELFSEGYSVRATIDRELQDRALWSLRRGLENYDRGQGRFHGAIAQVDIEALNIDWQKALENTKVPRDIEGWFPAVVLTPGEGEASIGIEGVGEAQLTLASLRWARYVDADGRRREATRTDQMLERGDVIFVKKTDEGGWSFRQIPKISGAFSAIDPRSGRVLAIVGGFSYQHSNYNRATQAMRQPGSSFKPFVYAAALDSGFMPNVIIVDAPIEINTPQGIWRPQNASERFYGPTPMMTGLEQSRNLMTIRLAQEVGMDIVADYGERYGAYDDLRPVLANSLGSQETTLYRMISAYSVFANGGRSIEPTVVDRVQDRSGATVYAHDQRDCIPCVGNDANPDNPPKVLSRQQQVMDPITAYQITSMLQSVVKNGTAKKTVGKLGLPIAGKTGTTNEAKDVWFVGYTPKIVAGCYMGFDNPTPLGRGASGGSMCGPVFSNFITKAVKKYSGFKYEIPAGGYIVKLDRETGKRLADDASGPNVIVMLFRNDTVPDVGTGGNFIDGGFAMGEDLLLFGQEKINSAVEVNVGGEVKELPKNPSFGTISSGGLY